MNSSLPVGKALLWFGQWLVVISGCLPEAASRPLTTIYAKDHSLRTGRVAAESFQPTLSSNEQLLLFM